MSVDLNNLTNSSQMTLAERLAIKIKGSPMGELLDEDDLAGICKDAIERAFFQNRVVKDGSFSTRTLEPLVVEEARDTFKAAMKPLIEAAAAELVASPEFRAALIQAAVACLPDMLMNSARSLAAETAYKGATQAIEEVQSLARAGLLARP